MMGVAPHSQQDTMVTRRNLLLLSAAAGGLSLLHAPKALAQRAGATEAALAFVNSTARAMLDIVNSPDPLPDKQRKLQPLIDHNVDVDGIARFCLGRFWRGASLQQQQDYTKLFRTVLLNSITGRLGDYSGVKIDIGQAHAQPDEGVVVSTTITRPNNAPNTVDWLIVQRDGQERIADMIAEGTSLRLTQRSDYASYLSRNNNNVQALIDALRKQASS
jgi:phospholipid transport system substrate-binding protein